MIRILFYILVALFPLGAIFKFSPVPSVQIAGQDIVVLLILIFSSKQIVKAIVTHKNKITVLLFTFFIISILGVAINTNSAFQFFSSVSYLVRLYAYILLIIPMSCLSRNVLRTLRLEMIVSGCIFILFGYVQYIFYPNLRNLFYLGWDEHLYRLFSTFFDPNFAGTFIVLILFLYVSIVMERFSNLTVRLKIMSLLPVLFITPALFLTYSRSALITGICMAILFFVMAGYRKIIFPMVALCLLGLFILPQNFGGEGVNLFRTASIMSRFYSNAQALAIFQDNPIIGVGFNTLRFTQDKYNFILKSEVLTSHAAAGFPNSYLVILTTTGVLGFLLFTAFIYIVLRTSITQLKINKENNEAYFLGITFFVTLCGILLNSLFENVLFYAPIMIWLVILYGMSRGVNKS